MITREKLLEILGRIDMEHKKREYEFEKREASCGQRGTGPARASARKKKNAPCRRPGKGA